MDIEMEQCGQIEIRETLLILLMIPVWHKAMQNVTTDRVDKLIEMIGI